MRIAILICCVLALVFLALAGLSYLAGIPSEVSVTGIDDEVIIKNVGNTPCVVVVNSVEGEQQFELAVGANITLVTLSNITGTTGVLAFGSATVRVDLEEMGKMGKPMMGWPGIKCKVSSNFTSMYP
jgi:hypothetical protein